MRNFLQINESSINLSTDEFIKQFVDVINKLNKSSTFRELQDLMGDYIDFDNGRDIYKIVDKYKIKVNKLYNLQGPDNAKKIKIFFETKVKQWITDNWKEFNSNEELFRCVFNYLMTDDNYHQFANIAIPRGKYTEIIKSMFPYANKSDKNSIWNILGQKINNIRNAEYISKNKISENKNMSLLNRDDFKKSLINTKVNESDEGSLEDIIGIKEYFDNCGYPLTDKFNLLQFSKEVDLPVETCKVLLCNMETGEVMQDIANGDYDSFDVYDSSQFNDSYEDMMEELGLETDLDESAESFIKLVASDYQFDKNNEYYCGFLNIDPTSDFGNHKVDMDEFIQLCKNNSINANKLLAKYNLKLDSLSDDELIIAELKDGDEVNESLEKNTIPLFNGLSAYQKPKEYIEPNKIMSKISDILAAGKKLIITADIWNQPGVPAHKQESEFNVEALNGNILKVISAKYGKEYEIKNPKNIEELYVVDSIEEKLEILDENEEPTEIFKIEDYPKFKTQIYDIADVTKYSIIPGKLPANNKLAVVLDEFDEIHADALIQLINDFGLTKISSTKSSLRLVFIISKLS